MDEKYAVCVLEAIGNGLTLSNENDKESACLVAIKAIDTVERIKEIIREPYTLQVSTDRPNQADWDRVSADKYKRIWEIVSKAEQATNSLN